ncbi:MAG TPA: matrixin family metalloprotease [Candidatus Paceibacterota bacterium]
MIKNIVAFVAVAGFVAAAVPVEATPPEMVVAEDPAGKTVSLPAHAVEIAPGIYSLGLAVAPDGRVVEGIVALHHRDGHSGGPGGGGGGGDTPSSCYAYLAKDAKWKTIEPWIVNPGTEDLGNAFVVSTLANSIASWEAAANADILGFGSSTAAVLEADMNSPDGVNEVYFADIAEDGVIGVTITWGIFSGPPFARELVEWDMVYDDQDFDWSETGEAGKMDFQNIAMHELGHAMGMGHPDISCTLETMHRYASEGEIIKRDLHEGDIAGIGNLY